VDGIVDALEAQQAELTGMLTGLDDAGWARPSPCEGWDVADVVLHLVQTNEMAEASLGDTLPAFYESMLDGATAVGNVDDGAGAMVQLHRGAPNPELLERWTTGAARLTARFRADDPSRRVTWVAGTLSVRTLSTTRLSETWIHTWDVADALGVEMVPGDHLQEIARLAWRTLPYAFQRSGRELGGPVAFELTGPAGQAWSFVPDEAPSTTISGPATELCAVAARRTDPTATSLVGDGPDADAVLELVRTYA
jgi:uncharacterized protein (TIGR03084 family)